MDVNRREAAIDLAVAVSGVLVTIPCMPAFVGLLRRTSGFAFVLLLAAFQFASEGLLPLILMRIRREAPVDFGFSRRALGRSLALGIVLVGIYDLAMSLNAHGPMWIPLRRHNALRQSMAAGLPLNLFGVLLVVATWGFFEAFYGVFFAKKLNRLLGHSGYGWLAPGVLGFALFNGFLHAAIGQGVAGFLASFASGYGIAVIPAVARNSWGSTLFQTATNAVGGL